MCAHASIHVMEADGGCANDAWPQPIIPAAGQLVLEGAALGAPCAQVHLARWLLHRLGEDYNIVVTFE